MIRWLLRLWRKPPLTYRYTVEACTTPVADHPPALITADDKAVQLDYNRVMSDMCRILACVPALQGWYYRPVSDARCREIYYHLERHGA